MRLISKVEPQFFPDPDQKSVLHLGLQSLDATTWIQRDADFDQFLIHKKTLKQQWPEKIYGALPGSEAAQAEFHQYLVTHLIDDYGLAQYQSAPFQSLWETSLFVQEDICLLEPKNNHFLLTAASVCSPSNWKLEDKLGGDVDFIHQPVPGYSDSLGARVNRLFNKLKENAPLLRFNWSLQSSNELFWRDDLQERQEPVEPHWYWRVERQTLRRLPSTQAIVFGIRIYLHDLEKLDMQINFSDRLKAIVRRLPGEQKQYKGLERWLAEQD